MRILFIVVIEELNRCEKPGIMYLSAALKQRGHEVRLATFDQLGCRKLRKLMSAYLPDVVGYTATTGEHIRLIEINRVLKKDYRFISVWGGPHPTFYPGMIKEEGCDAICIGEGDIAFPEFCRRLSCNEAYWQTPNFIVKYEGKIIRNQLMPLIENLDELPFPDRALMHEGESSDMLYNSSFLFVSSRGCPYKCTYCFNHKYNEMYQGRGRIVRCRSPENFVAEVSSAKECYRLKFVQVCDDLFILKPIDWLRRFARLYKEKVGLSFTCNVRADLVNEEVVSLLKGAGLELVYMGIECGNENSANHVLGRNLSNEQIFQASRIIKKYGIKLTTLNILGLPVADSYQNDLQTLDLNIKLKPEYANATILYPYPGTPIAAYAHRQGFLKEEASFIQNYNLFSTLSFSKKEKRRIENLQKLFDLMVNSGFLRKFCDLLCALPLGRLYVVIYYIRWNYKKRKNNPFMSLRRGLSACVRLCKMFFLRNK